MAIDHLLAKQGGGHDGHDQTGMLSARISCSAVGLNWFGQIDTTSSYSAGGQRLQPVLIPTPLTSPHNPKQYGRTYVGAMSVDHASGVAAPRADPVFLHVRAGMTVIIDDGSDWRMADVIWVDGGARNPKVPTLFQVADVDTGVINWVNADLVTHIVPRV